MAGTRPTSRSRSQFPGHNDDSRVSGSHTSRSDDEHQQQLQQQQQQQQQYTGGGHSSHNAAQSDHERSDSRTPRNRDEHHMEVEDSDSSTDQDIPLTNTVQLFRTLESLKPLLPGSLNEIKGLKKAASAKSSDDTAELKQQLENLRLEKQTLEARCKELSTNKGDADRIKGLEDNLTKFKESREAYIRRYSEQVLLYKKEHEKVEELEKTVDQHKLDMEKMSNECVSMNEQLSRKQQLYETISKEKTKLEHELSENKTRLSRLMGNKLSDNNPNLADLSDKYRPTKIAEKYTELYDNEWTDAFEVFVEHCHDEKNAIERLLQVLKDVKAECDVICKGQQQLLKEAVLMKKVEGDNVNEAVRKQMKDFRRCTAEAALPEVLEKCLRGIRYKRYSVCLKDERAHAFVKGCVDLCWLMSVQDPPLVFGETPAYMYLKAFDTNTYKAYTKTGPQIDYIVWPSLLLNEGGPLLSKGIAQGYGRQENVPTRQKKSAAPDSATPDYTPNMSKEPMGQTMDRILSDRPGLKRQNIRGHDDSFSTTQKHDNQNSNYEQWLVSDKFSQRESFSRTTSERGSPSAKTRVNLGISHRENVSNINRPVNIPETYTWQKFVRLAGKYGMNSDVVRNRLEGDYNTCLEYWNYMYGGDVSHA